jgi:hypothetical protein
MDVQWPAARLALQPQRAQTYPEVPVTASLQFVPTTCVAAAGAVIPELWLELLFCGHSPAGCADSNASNTQVPCFAHPALHHANIYIYWCFCYNLPFISIYITILKLNLNY